MPSPKIEFVKTPAAPVPPPASTKTGARTTDVSPFENIYFFFFNII